MSLDNFQEHFSWKDSVNGVALKRPWLQTMLCTIRHANSNIIIHCKEQKSDQLWQKERSMTHQVRTNAQDFIQEHPVQRRPKKPSVSSADNPLEPMVFTKLQHFKWTVKFETGPPLLKTHITARPTQRRGHGRPDAKYHTKCLSVLQDRVRNAESEGLKYKAKEREVPGIVFAELVLYIEETRLGEDMAQVFKLANIIELYQCRMQQLGVEFETKVHSTRLKQRLLAQFHDMCAHTKGRDVLLVFEEDVGAVPTKACELYSDNDVVHLARAAQTVRRHMFEKVNPLTDSQKDTKKIMCHHCYLPW